jgi:integrase
MGHIYQRGSIYWIKYYRHGKSYRESTKSDKKEIARRLLKKREGEIAEGKLPGIYFDEIEFDDLAQDFITDYQMNKKHNLKGAQRSVEYLKTVFGGKKAIDVTTDKIKEYTKKRIEEGLSYASINRELSALKRIFHLAAQNTPPKVNFIPFIPMLKESNIRTGFFEHEQYLAIKNALPDYMRPIITFGYHTGWRKSEVLKLEWPRVDLRERIVRLNPGETKNEEGRNLYLEDELLIELQELFKNRRLDCPYVFQKDGKPIKDFRKAWKSACIEAGFFKIVKDKQGNETKEPTKIFHDFRRTAIRNMIRSGISERVAMMISGHKTRSVFDRYNIVSDQDLKEAAEKKQVFFEKQETKVEEIKRGEVLPFKKSQGE